MITDRQIKSAISAVSNGKARIELRDNGVRGAGRLVLIVRKVRERVVAEWYAVYYRAKARKLTKIGSYRTMSLASARELFRENYVPVISAGAEPSNPYARCQHKDADLSVRALFSTYVNHLRQAGKPSWYQADRQLLKRKDNAADAIGADLVAKSIKPATIVAHLANIHSRGKVGMAHNARAYISAAFSFGMKAEHDYTREAVEGRWGITSNPVAAIPMDLNALKVGQRYLTCLEWRLFWEWLHDNHDRWFTVEALLLILLTGQRVQEILRLKVDDYDKSERLLSWKKTKNGHPHSIPVPDLAIPILDGLTPTETGWYFQHRYDATRHAIHTTPNKLCALYADETGAVRFTPRDLRRTWKTLAGQAGISKDMRDRLQNHLKSNDVSTRHYDRYNYLGERRAAMAQWNTFVVRILAGELDNTQETERSLSAA